MKKQTALLLSTLVLMSAVSLQPVYAAKCKCNWKFWEKCAKKEVVAPVKAPEAAVKPVETKVPVAVKASVAPVKPVAATSCPAKAPVKPAVAKTPVKK